MCGNCKIIAIIYTLFKLQAFFTFVCKSFLNEIVKVLRAKIVFGEEIGAKTFSPVSIFINNCL